LKHLLFISFFCLIILPVSSLKAQEFYSSLNSYNNILLNPSYAGFKYKSNVWSSYSVFAKSKDEIFNEFTLVYDRYSPKLKGGTAIFFKQGLQADVNINTLEFGFSFAPRIKRFKGIFFPSGYIGYTKPVKQWFAYGFDEWRNSFENYQNTPGKAFLRSDVYKLGGSMLFIVENIQFGISGYYGFQLKNDEKVESSRAPYKILAHFSTRANRKSNGVLSRSKEISPQFILHYENGLFQSKSELRVTGKKFLYSVFLLNNFSDNIHNLGGSAGIENDGIRLVLSAGFGSTVKLDKLTLNSSISLILKLPKENIKRLFPFKPLDD